MAVPAAVVALLVALCAGPADAASQDLSGSIESRISVGDIELASTDLGTASGTVDLEAGTVSETFTFGVQSYSAPPGFEGLVELDLDADGPAVGTVDASTGAVTLPLTLTFGVSVFLDDQQVGSCLVDGLTIPFTGTLDPDEGTLALSATGVVPDTSQCVDPGPLRDELAKGIDLDWTVYPADPPGSEDPPSTTVATTTTVAPRPGPAPARPIRAAASFTG